MFWTEHVVCDIFIYTVSHLSFDSYFTANLSFSLLVKEFFKLLNIWRSYWQNS